MIARILPRSARADWIHEWESELIVLVQRQARQPGRGQAGRAQLAQHTAGALVDAAWLRRQFTRDAEFVQDVRYSARLLRKHIGFSTSAVLVLGLGIGATTSIFSVVNAVLLKPLPYSDPNRLAFVWERNAAIGKERDLVAPLNYQDWTTQNTVFETLAAYRFGRFVLTRAEDAEEVVSLAVSSSLFRVLGVEAALGRTFTEEEERRRDRVVVLTHEFWQRRFGSDPRVVGKTITLTDVSFTVVGVMPPAFRFPEGNTVELYSPLAFSRSDLRGRRAHSLMVIGRLRDNVTIEGANAGINTIARNIAAHDETSNPEATVIEAHELLVEDVRSSIVILFGAVGLLLLITCVNVANLLLARGASRHRELAIRAALGSNRFRLIRQLLTESVLLALLGGVLGTLMALWSLSILRQSAPPDLPRMAAVGVDVTVLLFTAGIALLTGVVFGIAPAAQLAGLRLTAAHITELNSHRVSATFRRRWYRSGLVVVEVALSVILLAAAGLMIRSSLAVQNLDLGFEPDNVLTLQIWLPSTRYPIDPAQYHPARPEAPPQAPSKPLAFFEQFIERVRVQPGVESAAAVSSLPLNPVGIDYDMPVVIQGRPPARPGEEPQADFRVATTDYFRTMRIPLLKGRQFVESDAPDSAAVVIINDTMARQMFAGEDPLGRRLVLYGRPREIVGVVGAVRHHGYSREPRPEMILPFRQFQFASLTLVVRSPVDPLTLTASIKRELRAMDPGLPLTRVRPLLQYVGDSVARLRLTTLLLGAFAFLALALSIVGVYGVMAHSVTQRAQEVGVRMALGADRSDVLKMVIHEGMALAFVGVAIGLVGAALATQLMSGVLFGIDPLDPGTFTAAALALVTAALIATYIPARRAARLDPVLVLRSQ